MPAIRGQRSAGDVCGRVGVLAPLGKAMDPSQLQNRDIDRLQKLFRLSNSPNEHEADNARRMLTRLLEKLGLQWSDLDEVMRIDLQNRSKNQNVLVLVESLIARYVWLPPEEHLVVALWMLHTHIFERYTITPRLGVVSPVFGCGKSTLLTVIQQVAFNPSPRYTNLTPALIFRLIDSRGPQTLFIDEANNLDILQDKTLRAVLNSNKYQEMIGRAAGHHDTRDYNTFAPIVIAGKGKLPNDLMQRSIIINMQRFPPTADVDDLAADERDPHFQLGMTKLRELVEDWAFKCTLDPKPENPLRGRRANNWQPLFAIADSFGRGKEARAAALKLNAGLPDEDYRVFLLEDTRDVFDDMGVDRIWTSVLLDQLHALGTGMWSEWTGENDDKQPHKLTATEYARMVRDFKIKPRTVLQLGPRQSRGPSASGYYLQDFEPAFASYCSPRTPTHGHTARLTDDSE